MILIFILFVSACSIHIHLTNEPLCFGIQGGITYRVHFVISGRGQGNVRFYVEHNDQVVAEVHQRDYNNVVNVPEGDAKLCFDNQDGENKVLSIDFYPEQDPLKNLITKKEMKTVEGALIQVYKEIQQTHQNQQFQTERDIVHRTALEQTEWHIKWLGILKVATLLIAALVQLWVMKMMLGSGTAQRYDPVSE